MSQSRPYYLQCDISQYFASISHDILRALLRRVIKDPPVLRLLDVIISQPVPGTMTGRGLPIGNLTSQYFANLYLGELDHFLLERVKVGGYVRYMDDFLVFGNKPEQMAEVYLAAQDFLADKLCLRVKEKSVSIAPTGQGISFLGFRVWPGTVRLQNASRHRFVRRWRQTERAYNVGKMSEEAFLRSAQSRVGHLLHADTLNLRKGLWSIAQTQKP